MAYDEELAERVRQGFGRLSNLTEKKMFGGLCFLIAGNMCCGLVGDELMVRVGPDAYDDALADPHAREMDFTGRSLKGFVYVSSAGLISDSGLSAWVDRAVAFAGTLPAKLAKPITKPTKKKAVSKRPVKPSAGRPRRRTR